MSTKQTSFVQSVANKNSQEEKKREKHIYLICFSLLIIFNFIIIIYIICYLDVLHYRIFLTIFIILVNTISVIQIKKLDYFAMLTPYSLFAKDYNITSYSDKTNTFEKKESELIQLFSYFAKSIVGILLKIIISLIYMLVVNFLLNEVFFKQNYSYETNVNIIVLTALVGFSLVWYVYQKNWYKVPTLSLDYSLARLAILFTRKQPLAKYDLIIVIFGFGTFLRTNGIVFIVVLLLSLRFDGGLSYCVINFYCICCLYLCSFERVCAYIDRVYGVRARHMLGYNAPAEAWFRFLLKRGKDIPNAVSGTIAISGITTGTLWHLGTNEINRVQGIIDENYKIAIKFFNDYRTIHPHDFSIKPPVKEIALHPSLTETAVSLIWGHKPVDFIKLEANNVISRSEHQKLILDAQSRGELLGRQKGFDDFKTVYNTQVAQLYEHMRDVRLQEERLRKLEATTIFRNGQLVENAPLQNNVSYSSKMATTTTQTGDIFSPKTYTHAHSHSHSAPSVSTNSGTQTSGTKILNSESESNRSDSTE